MGTLKRQEPSGEGLRRIACEAVEAGVRALTRRADQADAAERALREAEAVLALLGPALPPAAARRDRALLGRLSVGLDELLAPARLRARLDKHYKKPPADTELASAVKAVRKRWSGKHRPAGKLNARPGSFDPAIYRLVADMAELRGHIGNWPIEQVEGSAPPAGLRRTYTRTRRLTAGPIDTAEACRELGASVSLLSGQLGLLTKMCPTMLKAQRKLLRDAGEQLETLHADHALDRLLKEALGRRGGKRVLDQAAFNETVKALSTGLQVAFAESAAGFSNRMGAYWSAWRG